MKKLSILLTCLLSLGVFSASAAQVEVEFSNWEKYRDIRPADNQNRHSFRENVFKHFSNYFAEQGENLPANQTLKVEFTNIDLAGEVLLTSGRNMRIVKDIYFPRLAFKYQLVEGDKVISEGEANIKDMNFLRHIGNKSSLDSFPAEKRIIDKWFKETLL